MPRNIAFEKTQAERGVEELLKGRPGASVKSIADTEAATAASRGRFASNIAGMGEGGAASVSPFVEDLSRVNKEALDIRRTREERDDFGQTVEFLTNRLVNSGLDRAKAEEVAMQYAIDQDRRSSITKEKQRERELTLKKQDIMDREADNQIRMAKDAADRNRVAAFKNAIYKSLFTGVGTAVGFAIGGPVGAVAGASVGSTASDFAGTGDNPRASR